MDQPFSEELSKCADSMGVSLYQRFTLNQAALFLRCPLKEVKKLQKQGALEYLQVSGQEAEIFGYQLLTYLLSCVSTESFNTPPASSERILRIKEVVKITSLSRTSIWRLERSSQFPSRVPLCTGSVGWRMSEIEEWIRSR